MVPTALPDNRITDLKCWKRYQEEGAEDNIIIPVSVNCHLKLFSSSDRIDSLPKIQKRNTDKCHPIQEMVIGNSMNLGIVDKSIDTVYTSNGDDSNIL